MSILLIGAGNMGAAFLPSLVQEFYTNRVYVVDTDESKLQTLQEKFGLKNISTDPLDFLDEVEFVLLAIKPQTLESFCEQVGNKLQDKTLISIMAGVSMAKIQKLTGSAKIIRSMPNLAVSVQNSVIGYLASSEVSLEQKNKVKNIFEKLGYSLELKTEDDIDKITALSGSGPAYYFYLTEILQEKAVEFGFDTKIAEKIAENTLIGAANLVKENNFDTKTWKEMVTSKGGTTEAALLEMQQNNFAEIFKNSLDNAKNRAKELNH
jgi:pyrroline-5-carboxylate reductase